MKNNKKNSIIIFLTSIIMLSSIITLISFIINNSNVITSNDNKNDKELIDVNDQMINLEDQISSSPFLYGLVKYNEENIMEFELNTIEKNLNLLLADSFAKKKNLTSYEDLKIQHSFIISENKKSIFVKSIFILRNNLIKKYWYNFEVSIN